MSRLGTPDPATMTEDQRRIHDEIVAGPRGKIQGPLGVWLHSPGLADHAQKLGQYARFESVLPPRLSELAILVTGRFWGAHYEWYAHKKIALEAGVSPAIIDAIRDGEVPEFENDEQRVIYEVAMAMHRDRKLSDPLYAKAIKVLGQTAVIDLIGILGYYTLVSMTLNAFQVPLPEGEVSEIE